MKKLFIILILICLFACQKDNYDFDCVRYVTIYIGICPVVIQVETILNDVDYDTMHDYENANNCHCLPYVCPQ